MEFLIQVLSMIAFFGLFAYFVPEILSNIVISVLLVFLGPILIPPVLFYIIKEWRLDYVRDSSQFLANIVSIISIIVPGIFSFNVYSIPFSSKFDLKELIIIIVVESMLLIAIYISGKRIGNAKADSEAKSKESKSES